MLCVSFETPAPSGDFPKGFKAQEKKWKKRKKQEKGETENWNKTAITSKVSKIQQI